MESRLAIRLDIHLEFVSITQREALGKALETEGPVQDAGGTGIGEYIPVRCRIWMLWR